MDITLLIILILSLVANIVLAFYIKKPGSPSNSKSESSEKNSIISLTEENEKLKIQIDLLQAKNNSLAFKIEELTIIVDELNSQKKYLANNIEKLEKLQREKDEICAIAAHDIKNPAGTIKNLVKLLDTYDLTVTEQKQIHESLVSISSRILCLVEEVTNTVNKDVITFTMNFAKRNFNSIIDLIANRYIGISKRKSIEIIKTKSEEIIELEFDANKLEEAVENLVGNAMKFAPEGSKVELKSYTEEHHLVFEVIDDGYGLSEEELQKAFNRGTTLSTKPTAKESSSGLGLWIVKRIIDDHNGFVWVKSRKGSGSTFAFKIPLHQNELEQ